MIELSIKVANSDRSFTHRHLVHEEVCLIPHDPVLMPLVHEAIKLFKGDDGTTEIEDVVIKAKMVWT